jgi:dTDP-4-dehydrorhamnose reductase
MKILITGDEGFVGTNFKKHLDSKRNSITGIDIKSGVDVRDFFAKDDTKFDVVIHHRRKTFGSCRRPCH